MGNSEISLELVLSVSYFNLSAFIVFLNEEIIGNKKRCVCKMCTGISLLKFRSICVSPWITVWWRGMDSHLNVLKIGLQKQSLHHPQEGWWKRCLKSRTQMQAKALSAIKSESSRHVLIEGWAAAADLGWCLSDCGAQYPSLVIY